jgi:hypothetical protein
MSQSGEDRTSELWVILTPMLGRIARLEHRPSPFRTSFAIEEIDVVLDDGTSLAILLKDLRWQALPESIRRVKPAFLHNPLREIDVYRGLLGVRGRISPLAPVLGGEGLGVRGGLSPLAPEYGGEGSKEVLGTAHCYGAVIDPAADRYWLFLERVPGRELYQVGEFSTWRGVARWLALFHRRFSPEPLRLRWAGQLLKYSGDYYRAWLERARAFLRADSQDRSTFERLAERYDRVIERLLALPATFVHGDFHASNVLVQETAAALRVCPVDWELAAVGPGLMDLAALTAGWAEAERTDLAFAYHAEWAAQAGEVPEVADFLSNLDHCRLHQAVQWLGWAPDWSPPPEHRQDWLGEALRLADRIGL